MFLLARRLLRFAVCFSCIGSLGASLAHAQATTTASKAADVYVFGGVELADPSYGPTNNVGGAVGVDFTRYFHIPVQPSLEIRANFNNGTYADERSYLFGLRAQYQVERLRPYVDFLVGPGNIHFPKNINYPGDNSTVYNYGGGVDLDITPNVSLKLDLQQQRWNTGEVAFTPLVGIIGVNYRIPFHPHNTQAALGR